MFIKMGSSIKLHSYFFPGAFEKNASFIGIIFGVLITTYISIRLYFTQLIVKPSEKKVNDVTPIFQIFDPLPFSTQLSLENHPESPFFVPPPSPFWVT